MPLYTVNMNDSSSATIALESGKIIYYPKLAFTYHSDEQSQLFTDTILGKNAKNISYDYQSNHLSGLDKALFSQPIANTAKRFMHRFAEYAKDLVHTSFPEYQSDIRWGRTSYRPAEISGRQTSKRKDDTRLHVDAFPSSPVHGLRILRVFCNINPAGKTRVWHVGAPFHEVLDHFSERLPTYHLWQAKLLKWVKATRTTRSAYDHFMIQLHDTMKLDDEYQKNIAKETIEFPAPSTWIVFTDQVSHAALSGQFLLEQTFYLPVKAMVNPELSPLRQLARKKSFSLEKIAC